MRSILFLTTVFESTIISKEKLKWFLCTTNTKPQTTISTVQHQPLPLLSPHSTTGLTKRLSLSCHSWLGLSFSPGVGAEKWAREREKSHCSSTCHRPYSTHHPQPHTQSALHPSPFHGSGDKLIWSFEINRHYNPTSAVRAKKVGLGILDSDPSSTFYYLTPCGTLGKHFSLSFFIHKNVTHITAQLWGLNEYWLNQESLAPCLEHNKELEVYFLPPYLLKAFPHDFGLTSLPLITSAVEEDIELFLIVDFF